MQKTSACVFAFSLGLGAVADADAPTVVRYSFKGASASANADVDDATGCISAGIYVSASEETTKDTDGNKTKSRSAIVSYGGRDDCQFLSFGNYVQVPLTGAIGAQSFTLPFAITIDYVTTDQLPHGNS